MADKLYEDSETGCCKRFDPKPWNEKKISLDDKLFLKDRVNCFFRIPMNFDKIMIKNMDKIMKAGALADEPLMLYDCNSFFGADVYIAVSKKVPGADMRRISGTFLTKVFEGSYNNTGNWIAEMKKFVESKNKQIKKMYFFYTTCPSCAKVYGKNYTVVLAEI